MTTKIDWKAPSLAIAKSGQRYFYQVQIEMQKAGLKPSPILNEFNTEFLSLINQVFTINSKEDNAKNINHVKEDDKI